MSHIPRRQGLLLGLAFIFLGLAVVGGTVLDSHKRNVQSDRFQACISEQFSKLTTTLTARGKIADRDSKSKTLVILTVANAASPKSKDTNPAKTVRDALERFRTDQAKITAERAQTVYPPYPDGKCS